MYSDPINNLPDKQDADERGVSGASSVTNEEELDAVEPQAEQNEDEESDENMND
ncbi:hypothetical protein [Pedobacter mucosus]|uniref:hypothetical protein n=1 Tax=Pedobacter mucosus TaxID=2895286 RepID=UPI001EE3CF11|nr:hypothetical protein [Pedobacter mucosus]UKT62267.1 hypothetical protein LOK61_10885 [Pedobacter mucosus]